MAQFLAELHCLAIHCQFGTQLENALRDRLVCGLKPSLQGAQKKLLGIKDLTLQKAIDVASSFESVEKNAEQKEVPLPSLDVQQVSKEPPVFVVGKLAIGPMTVVFDLGPVFVVASQAILQVCAGHRRQGKVPKTSLIKPSWCM